MLRALFHFFLFLLCAGSLTAPAWAEETTPPMRSEPRIRCSIFNL